MKGISSEIGAGGQPMQRFLHEFILTTFKDGKVGGIKLSNLDDSADFGEYVLTIDGHTVQPIFFPGGDIGRLAICGTINDLSVMGAEPVAIASSLIIQTGFPEEDLRTILASMSQALEEVGATLICGDTKVVDDPIDIYVTTAGIGKRNQHLEKNLEVVRSYREYPYNFIGDNTLLPGEKIIVTGTIGDHGISIMSLRENLGFETNIRSDVNPLWPVIKCALGVGGITAMKDVTRGGLSMVLNELATKSGVDITIYEENIPVRREVRAATEMLGLNIYEIACEGKAVIGVLEAFADQVLEAIRGTKLGGDAEIIGEVVEGGGEVILKTRVGGKTLLEPPMGDPVPRVC